MAILAKIKDPLLNVGRGFMMGGADIIPGVSGGTVALILGIYERLVNAISRFDLTFLGHVRKGEVAAAARHIDLGFLGTLFLGIGIGVIGLGGLMHYLLAHQLQYTFGAFFGLILASCWHVARIIDRWNVKLVGCMVAGAVGAFFLVALPVFKSPPDSAWYILACGCVSICAMILPGISGAFILLILGAYSELTGAIEEIKHGRIGGDVPLTLGAFALGATIGILSFTKFLKWLLARFESATMAVLCGFMIGSLRKIWPFKFDLNPEKTKFKLKEFRNEWPDWSAGEAWATIGLAVVAFGFVLLLERFGTTRSHSAPSTTGDV
jgi:putative membrane protein